MTVSKSQPRPVGVSEPADVRSLPGSDPEVLVELLHREWRASPYPDMQRLTCRFQEEQLVLQGRVRSFFLKQMAQVMAVRLANSLVVENQVEVVG